MRFKGYFSKRFEPPAPFIRTLLVSERLGLKNFVDFLVDTGASVTILLDKDIERLRIYADRLRRAERDVGGLGGFVETYRMDEVRLFFRSEEGSLHEEMIGLHAGRHDPDRLPQAVKEMVMLMPSLLGRDLIYRFKLYLNSSEEILYLEL